MKNKLVDTAPHFISIDKTCQSGSCMYVCLRIGTKKDLKNFLKSFATKKKEKAVRTDFISLSPEEFRGLDGNKCHDF